MNSREQIKKWYGNLKTKEEVEKRFKKLAKKHHSDEKNEIDDEMMKLVIKGREDRHKELDELNNIFNYIIDPKEGKGISRLKRSCKDKELIIPSDVNFIADEAMWNKNGIDIYSIDSEKIVVPRSVNYIGINAFRYCYKTKEIVFEHGSTDSLTICQGAFSNCMDLERIILPQKTRFSLGRGKEKIFQGCSELKKITMPFDENTIDAPECYKNLKELGLESIEEVTIISDNVCGTLEGCRRLKVLNLNSSTTKLPRAFCKDCTELELIQGAENIIEFGDAFVGCPKIDILEVKDWIDFIIENTLSKYLIQIEKSQISPYKLEDVISQTKNLLINEKKLAKQVGEKIGKQKVARKLLESGKSKKEVMEITGLLGSELDIF